MDFRRQASLAPPGFFMISPFFSSTGVLMMLSSISVVSSTRSCSIKARRIRSHTPAFVHARNLLYTLCHGPNRSGKSLQGTPVLRQYRIALSISLLLFPGRPPCGFLYFGNKSLILFLCFSLISYRFILLILSFRLFVHNSWVLKQTLGKDDRRSMPRSHTYADGSPAEHERLEFCSISQVENQSDDLREICQSKVQI